MARAVFLALASLILVGMMSGVARAEELPEVGLPDVARQIAAARAAAEADTATLEDRIRFATWALMVAEFAIEPHGLVSTAADLFEEGGEVLGGVQQEFQADPEAERAFVDRAPLLAARLDAAVVRQERLAAQEGLARSEERKRLNDLRSIARAFRMGLAAQAEAQAWASLGDAGEAEQPLAQAWRALDEIDATISERRDYFLMEDEPDLEANPDVELLAEVPTSFRSPDVVTNVKAVASLRLLAAVDGPTDELFQNPDAPKALENSIMWANAALVEEANPDTAPRGFSPDNVFALYARGRATSLSAVLHAWSSPFDEDVRSAVEAALERAIVDCQAAVEKLNGLEESRLTEKLRQTLSELESPEYCRSRIAQFVESGESNRAVSEARSMAMRHFEPAAVALYIDTARRAGTSTSDLLTWCEQYMTAAGADDAAKSPELGNAVARVVAEVAAEQLSSAGWPQANTEQRRELMEKVLAARTFTRAMADVEEGDAAKLAVTRALLTAYAWLALPELPQEKDLLAAAVEDVRNAEVLLSQAVSQPPARGFTLEHLDMRESLIHCRLARGFLAVAVLPDYSDEARLAFAAAFDEAGRMPAGCREFGMLGSPLLTSMLRGADGGGSAELVAEERAARQAMTRFVEACFALEFGTPSQAVGQFQTAFEMSQRREFSVTSADAARLMQNADGFDVSISLPESMAAFEVLGLVAAGESDEALRKAVVLTRRPEEEAAVALEGLIDYESLAANATRLQSPVVAFAVARALIARLDSRPIGSDPERAAVLQSVRAYHVRCGELLAATRQGERYPHLVEFVANNGKELADGNVFSASRDIAVVERGLRRHPESSSLWTRYFELLDAGTEEGDEGEEIAEQTLAVLDALVRDPLVPQSPLALARAKLLEKLARYALAEDAYRQAKASASAEARVVAVSREAVLMARNAFSRTETDPQP